MDYQLSQPAVRGDQLVDEIRSALGIDISDHYGYAPPTTITIAAQFDAYAAQIAPIVAAHVPDPLYTQWERDSAALRQRITTIAQSAVGTTITDLTTAQIKALLACLLARIGAIDKDGVVQPLDTWI